MYERLCKRCGRICFTPEEYQDHECFDRKDMLDAEIAVCNWDGNLPEPTPEEKEKRP